MKKSSARNSILGFTLVEILIAILVLAGTSIVLYQSWSGSLSAIRKGRIYNTVTFLLQKRMVEFEIENKGKTVDEIKEEETGDFGSDYPDYSWEIKTKAFSLPPISIPGENKDQTAELIIKTMQEYFEKAVREISVTVIYTRGDKKLRYSLSSVFVDYTKELTGGL